MFLLLYGRNFCAPVKDKNMASPYKAVSIFVTHLLEKHTKEKQQRPDSWWGCLYINHLSYPRIWTLFIEWLRFLVLIPFFFWLGFQARKEPQSKSLHPYVLISVAILLCGALVISAVIAWYFWQKRKLKKSAPPKALIMDSIDQSGSSRKPRNEYVFLPQSWRVCLVTTLKPSRGLHLVTQSHY